MLLFWRVRYLDTRDKQFKDRDLWLETDKLPPETRAAVELCHSLGSPGQHQGMLRYRHLFSEGSHSEEAFQDLIRRHGGMGSVSLHDYFEDENGKALSRNRLAFLLTGRPNAIMVPAGLKQHDIEYMSAEKRQIQIERISLSQEQLNLLGYFSRDLREMIGSTFFQEGPGTLGGHSGAEPALKTAAGDEDIRSFITIFRRLYMTGEPAGFLKATSVFAQATEDYPLGKWVGGVATEYEADLQKKPDLVPFTNRQDWPFTRKRLIDVFLYTQYAHQPDQRRTKQFKECLAALDNRRPVLTWLFLIELWACSQVMKSAGVIVAGFFEKYCSYHGLSPEVIAPISSDNPGIGSLEKKEDRESRLFNDAVRNLARDLWQTAGNPVGGSAAFEQQARESLRKSVAGFERR